MAIKLAFSTVACPDWTLEDVAAKAADLGYEGVELRTLGRGSGELSCDPALSDASRVAEIFADKGIKPICLSTSICMHHRKTDHAHRAKFEAFKALETAAEIGCDAIRIFGNEVTPGESRRNTLKRIAEHTLELTDKAEDLGVQILFENSGSFAVAKEWWWTLDLIEHPMVGMLWNIANSVAADDADEGGWVSVSTLNSRIRIAKIKDARIGQASGYLPLGEGTVGLPTFLRRLRGVGFDGYLSVEWDRLWMPDALAPAEEFLPAAAETLRSWLKDIDESLKKGTAAKQKAADKEQKGIEKAMAKAKEKREAELAAEG